MASEIKLFNEDCMVAMKKMKDKAFDLAIVDPPYFDGPNKPGYFGADYSQTKVKRNNRGGLIYWEIPGQDYFDELGRVSREQIIFGFNYFRIMNFGSGRIIWDKRNDNSTFSKCEIAYSSQQDCVSLFRYLWNGMLQENMGDKKEIRIHPTQKPVALYKWLLKNYAKPGNKILDTHLGSGSIAIACYDMGFDLTGYEIDKDYFGAAVKRLENHKKQMTLF